MTKKIAVVGQDRLSHLLSRLVVLEMNHPEKTREIENLKKEIEKVKNAIN